MKNIAIKISATILSVIIILALLSPVISPYDPNEIGSVGLSSPSITHIFGTDDYGRDVFSRVISGARISISVAVVAVTISIIIGLLFGMIAGFYGGITDSIVMRFVDTMMAFPSIFLLLAIQAMLKPNIYNVMIVIGATSWMGVTRLVRAEILSIKERPFIEAEKAIGISNNRILFRHIIPNALAPVIVAATLGTAGAILTESALSYLGLGVQPPYSSWGNMLESSQSYMLDAPWMAIFPGLFIMITVLCIYYIGEYLRVKLNPKENNA